MRRTIVLFAVSLCAAIPASAQVTIDLHALDALPGDRSAAPPHAAPRPSRPKPREQAASKPIALPAPPVASEQPANPSASLATSAPATPPAATLPATPPPTVALAPVAPPAPEPTESHPAPPVSASAATNASTTRNGLRLTFGSGQTELSPASIAAIDGIAQGVQSHDSSSVNVVAYAAPTPDDPSTARRLSLSRALAVRSALMADGVSSSRIYVRALGGSETNDGPEDRVDVTLLGGNAPVASTAPASPAR